MEHFHLRGHQGLDHGMGQEVHITARLGEEIMAKQKRNHSSIHARGRWQMIYDSSKNKGKTPPHVSGRNFKVN